jgi:hypothetical protein
MKSRSEHVASSMLVHAYSFVIWAKKVIQSPAQDIYKGADAFSLDPNVEVVIYLISN